MLDTTRDVLKVLAARSETPRRAIAAAERVLEERERVTRERYNGEREREELARVDAAAIDEFRAASAEADVAIDLERDRALDAEAAARARRAEERRTLKDAIDVDELRETDDPAEIARLVADAELVGGEVVAEEARRIAVRRLKALTLHEQQRNVFAGPCFRALCRLSSAPEGGVSAAGIAQRHDRRKFESRRSVQCVADAVGLGAQFAKSSLVAAATQSPESSSTSTNRVVVGRFFAEGRHRAVPELRERKRADR